MSARAQPRLDEQWAGSLAEFRLLLDSGFLGPWTEMPLDEGGGLRMGCLARPGAGHAVQRAPGFNERLLAFLERASEPK